VKGISNRQKMIVKPRESVQKYVSQMKDLRKSVSPQKGWPAKRRDAGDKKKQAGS
jgi:hypothetical protein